MVMCNVFVFVFIAVVMYDMRVLVNREARVCACAMLYREVALASFLPPGPSKLNYGCLSHITPRTRRACAPNRTTSPVTNEPDEGSAGAAHCMNVLSNSTFFPVFVSSATLSQRRHTSNAASFSR